MNPKNDLLWQRKLMAFLHDPPCKCFNIQRHGERARAFRHAAGITDEMYKSFEHECDRVAAAADRFPFPDYQKSKLSSKFTGDTTAPFRHPLGGADLALDKIMETVTAAEDEFGKTIKGVSSDLGWQEKFWLYWRRWPEQSALHDQRLAYLPADTRLPDHTIWTHMSLTSALHACVADGKLKPAFLLFQMGGVQDFIGQAKKTRDSWSGSYLLSWLIAHAMKAIAQEIGPDAFIFPNLRMQPIFDALFREEIYGKIIFEADETLWARMYPIDKENKEDSVRRLLTPSLPNRFLALVPAAQGEALAKAAEKAIQTELEAIGKKCWRWLKDKGAQDDWKTRWDAQLKLFPQIAWTVHPWEQVGQDLMNQYKVISFEDSDTRIDPQEDLDFFRKLAVDSLRKHRDERCFEADEPKTGFFWPAYYALTDFAMAARRNTKDFTAFETDENQAGAPKDALSGKEEIIGDKLFWKNTLKTKGSPFEEDAPLGAMNILKRLWCRTESGYLTSKLGIKDGDLKVALRFDSVPEVAKENRLTRSDLEAGRTESSNRYVAIIALDGDQMGKWVAGIKTPAFYKQLSCEAQAYFASHMDETQQKYPRPLSPAYHLQFSEALANFTQLADPIVRHFKGQLIYAGGDDVVAMLPASRALECAYLLRCVFQGKEPTVSKDSKTFAESWVGLRKRFEFSPQEGWITLHYKDGERPKQRPFLVPGPMADVSCGIAIAHEKHPLQAIIREARDMETRAKKRFNRKAFSVALLKRGGETIHWGAKWDSPALGLYHVFCELSGLLDPTTHEAISNRFAHALARLLAPYKLGASKAWENGFEPEAIIRKEFQHVLAQQAGKLNYDHAFVKLAEDYLKELAGESREGCWDEFEKLFLTAVFIHRNREEA